MNDSTLYLQLYPDEGKRHPNDPFGTLIHTRQVPVTAIDQYRTYGVVSTNLNEIGACFIDTQCASAVAKIGEGGFTNHIELNNAEAALQAILLNNYVYVVRPVAKINGHMGVLVYSDQGGDHRTEYAHDLFSIANSRDWAICPDFFEIDHGSDLRIVKTRVLKEAVGHGLVTTSNLSRDLPGWDKIWEDAVEAFISEHRVPSYLSDKSSMQWHRGAGFQKHFYGRMKVQWDRHTAGVPPIVCSFSLPPLLAIVLDRLNNRQDLKSTINDLREELASARAELLEFNALLEKSISQAEIEERMKSINAAFDGILPESRLSRVEKRRRTFSVVHRLLLPIVRKMAAYVMSSAALTFDDIVASGENVEHLIKYDRSIVDRTITSSLFAEFINTESLQALVAYHFSDAEIRAIEASLRNQRL